MTSFLRLSTAVFTLAAILVVAPLVSVALAGRIEDHDRPINLTERVLDGSIEADVDRIYPELGPDGTKYNPESVKKYRAQNRAAHEEHCRVHLRIMGREVSLCGAGFSKTR